MTKAFCRGLLGAAAAGLMIAANGAAQATDDSLEWFTLGNDYAHTRYSSAAQITPQNFEDLDDAWTWDGASFDARSGRSTPS